MSLGLRAKITIVAGLAFALIFLVLGVRELRDAPSARAEAAIPANPSPAVPTLALATAIRTIRTGDTITPDMIRTGVGDPVRSPQVATTAEVIGKVAIMSIPAGTPITRSAIGAEDKLAIRVPVGMRAMSIDTTAEIAVAGLVRPGDRVDVQVVYPGEDAIMGARGLGRSHAQTLLQMVQVLAVGDVVVGTAAPADGIGGVSAPPPPPARTVTLALSPDQVSTLSLAKNVGALYLSLRNPNDAELAEVKAPAAVRRTISAPRRAIRAVQPQHAIELVVGDRRETIYSGGSANR